MLTALSVARDCEMIDEYDRIILVSAKPPPYAAAAVPVGQQVEEAEPLATAGGDDPAAAIRTPTQAAGASSAEQRLLTRTPASTATVENPTSWLQQPEQQVDSAVAAPLVEFHYAEDLHKPVTEVTATLRQRQSAHAIASTVTEVSWWVLRCSYGVDCILAYTVCSAPNGETCECVCVFVFTGSKHSVGYIVGSTFTQ